jgi:putative tricarboxylic transport membrane protein
MTRTRWWPKDATVGVVGTLFGVVLIIGALQIPADPSAFNVLGPSVAPLVIGIAMVATSVALIVQAMLRRAGPEDPAQPLPQPLFEAEAAAPSREPESSLATAAPAEIPETTSAGKQPMARVLLTFGLFTAYILVFVPLGYLLSTFAFLIALTTVVEPRRWLRNLLYSAGFALAVYFLFTRALQVDLPPGLLG